jgi:hypothetical protein
MNVETGPTVEIAKDKRAAEKDLNGNSTNKRARTEAKVWRVAWCGEL